MLFRSEEDVETWCHRRGAEVGGILPLATTWRLARAWYHDRLSPSWRRKTQAEAQALFRSLGMVSEFWQLS